MFSSTLPPLAIATKMRDPPSFSTHIRSNRTADGITVQYSHASRYLSYKRLYSGVSFSVSYQDFLISASSMPGVALPHLLITPLHAKEPSKDSMKF